MKANFQKCMLDLRRLLEEEALRRVGATLAKELVEVIDGVEVENLPVANGPKPDVKIILATALSHSFQIRISRHFHLHTLL